MPFVGWRQNPPRASFSLLDYHDGAEEEEQEEKWEVFSLPECVTWLRLGEA